MRRCKIIVRKETCQGDILGGVNCIPKLICNLRGKLGKGLATRRRCARYVWGKSGGQKGISGKRGKRGDYQRPWE